MKAVILAGGLGTRLSEETDLIPKPLVEIGGRPILWHIMKLYSAAGLNDFVICAGYKASMIKHYFASYFLADQRYRDSHRNPRGALSHAEVVGRLDGEDHRHRPQHDDRRPYQARRPYLDGTFCLTYGDGVANVDIAEVIAFHRSHGKLATVTAVPSPGRFGILNMEANDAVSRFHEKPDAEMGWINGGFFVLEPKVVDYIEADETTWEGQPLERLAADGQLMAYRHSGFWKAMDTLRDRRDLEELWASGSAPWQRW